MRAGKTFNLKQLPFLFLAVRTVLVQSGKTIFLFSLDFWSLHH